MPQLRKRVFVVAFAKEQVPSAAERLAALPTWVDSLRAGWPRRDLADFLLAPDHPDLLQELSKQKLAMGAPAIVLILHISQTDPSNRVQQGHPQARRHARLPATGYRL